MANTATSSQRLSLPVVMSFASTALPIAAIGLVMAVYLPRFFAAQLGLSLLAVGSAFTIVRLLDMALDPMLGMAMDRTQSRFGRYRPWLVLGAPIVMAASYMLFMAKPGITEGYLIGWLLVLYVGISILTLAQAAWAASLATDYHDRSRVYGVIQAVGVVGAVLILLLPLALGPKGTGANGVHAMGWFCIILLPITVALCSFVTPERINPETDRERATLADYWDLVRRPEMARLIFAIITAAVAYAFTQSALMIIPPATMSLAIPGMMSVGFVSSAFILIVRAMVADVADEVRLETGKERVGLLYALVTTTQKIGTAITVGISFWVLDIVGYNAAEGAVNTPAAIRGLELCYVFAPIIFVFFGGAAFIGWKLDATRHAEVRRQLDERDALAAQAVAS